MSNFRTYLAYAFRFISALAVVGIFSINMLTSSVDAAAPESMTIDGVECRLVLTTIPTFDIAGGGDFLGENNFRPLKRALSSIPANVLGQINANAALKSDMQNLSTAANDESGIRSYPMLVYEAVVAGDGSEDAKCKEYPSFMLSRPSDPNSFFGTTRDDKVLLTGEINPANSTFTFDKDIDGATTYNVLGDMSNPAFTVGGTTVGFCARTSINATENAEACNRASVVDFNTIRYRDESYILKEWKGGGDNWLRYELDVASSPYPSRKTALSAASCTQKPYIGIDNDGGGLLDELTTDNDGIPGFFGLLIEMGAWTKPKSESKGITLRDYDNQCNLVETSNFELHDIFNFRRIAQYFAKGDKAYIIGNNPGGGEAPLKTIFEKSPSDPSIYIAPQNSDCADDTQRPTLTFTETNPSTAPANTTYLKANWYFPNIGGSCGALGAVIEVKYTPTDSSETLEDVVADTGGEPAGGGDGADGGGESTCSSKGGALGWILCPVLTLLDETTQFLEDQISKFMFVEPSKFDTSGGMYKAWSAFRSIATVIIVIIALIMIFSQAMGSGIFDNYSVKKILPRLLIAGIGIQLSWVLIVQLVNIVNILGDGIGGLIGSPFRVSPDTNLRSELGGITGDASGGDFFTGLVVVAAAGFALIGSIVPLAIGAVAALFIGLITLIIRDMIILLGLVLAPIAIAMSVLPGTQKTSKWWWESLSKALLMYPIVIALLVTGKVIATLLFEQADPAGDEGVKMTYVIAGIIAWYAPFFFLPKALQAGGSALGKISGLAGDKSKGWFDRAKQANDSRKKYKSAASERRAFAGQKSWYENGGKLNPIGRAIGFSSRNLRKGGAYARQGGFGTSGDDRAIRSRVSGAAIAGFDKEQLENAGLTIKSLDLDKLTIDTKNTNLAELMSAELGKKIDIKDDMGKVIKTIVATEAVQRQAATTLAQSPSNGSKFSDSIRTMQTKNPALAEQVLKENAGDMKDKLPDFYGKSDLSKVEAQNLSKMDTTRFSMWQDQFNAAVTSGDHEAVSRFTAQINGNSKFSAQGAFADKLPHLSQAHVTPGVGGSVPPGSAAIQEVLASDGKKALHMDPTTGIFTARVL